MRLKEVSTGWVFRSGCDWWPRFGILGPEMEKEIFKQFEKQFGSEWVCSCGNPFKSDWVETISQNKNSFLAKYHCRICGQEQVFAASSDYQTEIIELPIVELSPTALSSDDVLDIREETAKLKLGQIRMLARKPKSTKIPLSKLDHKRTP